jgi:hypothetical protein
MVTKQLLPGGELASVEFWTGCALTADSTPMVGRTQHGNLFIEHRACHAWLDDGLRLGALWGAPQLSHAPKICSKAN